MIHDTDTRPAGMVRSIGAAACAHLHHEVEYFVLPYGIEGILLRRGLDNALGVCEDLHEGVTGAHGVHLGNFTCLQNLHLHVPPRTWTRSTFILSRLPPDRDLHLAQQSDPGTGRVRRYAPSEHPGGEACSLRWARSPSHRTWAPRCALATQGSR